MLNSSDVLDASKPKTWHRPANRIQAIWFQTEFHEPDKSHNDSTQLIRIMEMRRHLGDCANCTAYKVCDICYARIPGSSTVDTGFDPMFDLQCQQIRKTTIEMLRTYTEIMETNPNAFELPIIQKSLPNDKLRFGTLSIKPDETDLSKLKSEEISSQLIPIF